MVSVQLFLAQRMLIEDFYHCMKRTFRSFVRGGKRSCAMDNGIHSNHSFVERSLLAIRNQRLGPQRNLPETYLGHVFNDDKVQLTRIIRKYALHRFHLCF